MCAALLGTSAAAQSDGFCQNLDRLLAQADGVQAAMFDPNTRGAGVVPCTPSLGLGGTVALQCAWPFAYRAQAANLVFDTLLDQVATCAAPIAADPALVNHPDSYDLRQFSLGAGVVSVSLKDKGALNQTYVFLRGERPGQP